MARWLIQDSLSTPEQWFCSHLSSWTHWLREFGETTSAYVIGKGIVDGDDWADYDVAFLMDDFAAAPGIRAEKRIAQVAAVCSPQPWEVRKPDGSPWFDLIISSIPNMVRQARDAGCRAVYQALAFDHRALVCAAPTKDIDCIFVGTVDANHKKRAEVLTQLEGVVTVAPPCWGRDYYRLISRARVLVQVHAEWSHGTANALRLFEGGALSGEVVSDGKWDGPGRAWWQSSDPYGEGENWGAAYAEAAGRTLSSQGIVLSEHGYHRRAPQLIDWARSLQGGA